MKKNTASQIVGVQMITAADGTAFTGSVTCSYTIDGGTQTSGATVTHEGNGFHTMPVSATLSNGDHIGFTFIGTGAIPATVQVYTNFPQTVDNKTGITGGTITTVTTLTNKTGFSLSTAGILAIWHQLTSAVVTASTIGKLLKDNINATITSAATATGFATSTKQDTMETTLNDVPTTAEFEARTLAAAAYFDPAADTVANVTTVGTTTTNTDMRGTDSANTTTPLDAAGVRTAVGLASANMDTQFTASATVTGHATEAKQDVIDGIVDQILVDTGTTLDGKIDTIDTNVDAIKVPTDKMVFTKANELDVNTKSINDAEVVGDGNGSPWDGV